MVRSPSALLASYLRNEDEHHNIQVTERNVELTKLWRKPDLVSDNDSLNGVHESPYENDFSFKSDTQFQNGDNPRSDGSMGPPIEKKRRIYFLAVAFFLSAGRTSLIKQL